MLGEEMDVDGEPMIADAEVQVIRGRGRSRGRARRAARRPRGARIRNPVRRYGYTTDEDAGDDEEEEEEEVIQPIQPILQQGTGVRQQRA